MSVARTGTSHTLRGRRGDVLFGVLVGLSGLGLLLAGVVYACRLPSQIEGSFRISAEATLLMPKKVAAVQTPDQDSQSDAQTALQLQSMFLTDENLARLLEAYPIRMESDAESNSDAPSDTEHVLASVDYILPRIQLGVSASPDAAHWKLRISIDARSADGHELQIVSSLRDQIAAWWKQEGAKNAQTDYEISLESSNAAQERLGADIQLMFTRINELRASLASQDSVTDESSESQPAETNPQPRGAGRKPPVIPTIADASGELSPPRQNSNSDRSANPPADAMERLEQEIEAAKARLSLLREQATDQHPEVVALQDSINLLRDELHALRTQFGATPGTLSPLKAGDPKPTSNNSKIVRPVSPRPEEIRNNEGNAKQTAAEAASERAKAILQSVLALESFASRLKDGIRDAQQQHERSTEKLKAIAKLEQQLVLQSSQFSHWLEKPRSSTAKTLSQAIIAMGLILIGMSVGHWKWQRTSSTADLFQKVLENREVPTGNKDGAPANDTLQAASTSLSVVPRATKSTREQADNTATPIVFGQPTTDSDTPFELPGRMLGVIRER